MARGHACRPAFWKFLARDHAGYAELEKLKRHSDSAGTGTGKVRKAIEKVVVSAYVLALSFNVEKRSNSRASFCAGTRKVPAPLT